MGEAEYKMARKEKWDRDVGDCRQELVFIGGPQMQEHKVLPLLEACLLSDQEFREFKDQFSSLKVPDDDFHVKGLLRNLGATPEQIAEVNEKMEAKKEEDAARKKTEKEETELLRSLGVGCGLEPEGGEDERFEAID